MQTTSSTIAMPVPPPPQATKVFSGILADVYQWPQTRFDGSVATFECYVRHDTVAVLPFINTNTLLLTRQEQPGRPPFIDPPGGRVDPGETLEQAAKREFEEETGIPCPALLLWNTVAFTGQSRFEEAIYVTKGFTLPAVRTLTDAGEKVELYPVSLEEAASLALNGHIRRPEVALAILGMVYDPDQRARLNNYLTRV